ncbi:MAG TPA: winged helix-turn-helix domain-containing protein [Solirubrobacteraceae bacterium]|nr:winged helix-turn-helix domain-containing protein [Solirubrobacteraceae bacterium]
MISAHFDARAMARLRFAISPAIELAASVRALRDPGRRELHMPWLELARATTADLDLRRLHALQDSKVYSPDFVHPLPTGPLLDFAGGLEAMLELPAELVREEVQFAYREQPLPDVLEPFLKRTRGAVRGLAELMDAYWQRALAPHWGRIRSLLEQDVMYRARQIADGGTRRLFSDLDESVSWDGEVLRIDHTCTNDTLRLDGRGLLLIPSVFVGPKGMVVSAPAWQPTLIYQARGAGMLWEPRPAAAPDALAKLLGRNRAALLVALESPYSTSQLAGMLGVSSGGVSQQLSVLADAGLVRRRRVSQHVLYLRSVDGDALVQAAGAAA